MYLNATEDLIVKIRETNYPLLTSFSIKSAVFRSSGTDTLCDLDINIVENITNPKILKKQDKKENLKLKIFQISSDSMKNELLSATNIEQINNIINKYGTESLEIFPSIEFIGDKKDINQHYLEDDNVTLLYQKKFIFREKNLGFLSYGMIFYYSLQDFMTRTGLMKEYITIEALSSNLKIIDIFDESGKNVNPDIVQDIRSINKIFKTSEILEKINEKINFDYKFTKIASQQIKKEPTDVFFSDLHHSRDTLGNSNILFSIDYKKLIQKNSNFSKLLNNSIFSSDLQEKCKISSIKVVRRHLQYTKDNKKYYLKKLPVELVASTSQKKDFSLFLFEKEDNNSLIREIDLFDNFRTIEVVDKTLYKNKNSFYQYGVEITVNDGYVNYLNEIKKLFLENIAVFKSYLNETNNLVKYRNNSKNISPIQGFYDPITNSFTRNFAENVFPASYESKLTDAVTNFVRTIKLFGLLLDDDNDLVANMLGLLSPASANTTTINYFIKLYEKVCLQIERILKDNTNTFFTIEHWFEKQIINSSEGSSIGYGFFNIPNKKNELTRVSNQVFEEKIAKDIFEYTKNNSISEAVESYRFSSVGPEFINSKNKKIAIKNIRTINNDDFVDLELDIKRYNSLGNEEKEASIENFINSKSPEKQKLILKTEKLINSYSFITKNLFLPLEDNEKIKINAAEIGDFQDNTVNPEILFLGMLKNTKPKPFFNKAPRILKNNKLGIFSEKIIEKEMFIPFQIYSLIQKNDSIFSDANIKYLTNLENNSKFLLLYNTVHSIEIKLESKNIKDSNWQILTKSLYTSLPQNKKFLCRLKLFSDSSFDLNFFEEVSLPIFDKHFILEKNVSAENVELSLKKLKNTNLFYLLSLRSKIKFNKIEKTFKIIDVQKNIFQKNRPITQIPNLTNKLEKNKPRLNVSLPVNLTNTNLEILTKPITKLSAVIQKPLNELNLTKEISIEEQNTISNVIIESRNKIVDTQKTISTQEKEKILTIEAIKMFSTVKSLK